MFSTYDQWKLRSPDDDMSREFSCAACEDAGCPECCELMPIDMEDLDEICGDDSDRHEYETGGKP